MATVLGLDIGSNSVGSAWIDTDKKVIKLGCSVFPAGVEETDEKRGAPKNQARRSQRQQRRSLERRAKLKRRLRQYLIKKKWMPVEKHELAAWENLNPWLLRKAALERELTEYEFGRILLHLAQRRGAWWFDEEQKDTEKSKKNKAAETPGTIEYTKRIMGEKGAETFGKLIAMEYEERKTKTPNKKLRSDRVRNRANAFGDKESEYVADRHMIIAEFIKIWDEQSKYNGQLAKQLTENCKKELYNKEKTNTWRCQGVLFSQRKAYWNMGTLGRCDLEPTDMKCPKADMYAQEFLVLTSVNNIRITPPAESVRKLDPQEREKVVNAVRKQKTASESTIRKALGIDKGANNTQYTLNTDGDKFTVNGDWFYSQVVCGVFGEDVWGGFGENKKDSVNSAILKFDPNDDTDKEKFKVGCKQWWGLDDEQTEKLMAVWEKRPKKDTRVNLSRKAIKNLLPYLRDGWSVTEARDMFAEDGSSGSNDLTRKRYSTKEVVVNKRIRHFQKKHPELLPPVSDGISNPVVRKSIHEVRKHLMEYPRRYGKKPDRVVIELAREARQSEKVIARRIQKNKAIDALRKEIIETHELDSPDITSTQREAAIKRVRLCRQQRYACPYSGLNEEKDKYACAYSGKPITEAQAVHGEGLEIDHIVPRSKGGSNGMSNLVLCYSTANQGKGKRTPIDWLSKEDFWHLELRFKHLKPQKSKAGGKTGAITKDNVDMTDKAKWENLHRKTPKEGFTEEQLCSAAYAATQTTDWINKVLYGNENKGKRHVFASNGDYTGLLRRDWGLFFDESGERSEKGRKNRGDHRHHAVDAAVIAMTPQCFSKIKASFIDYEEQKENKNIEPKWKTIDSPWDGFSEQLAEEYQQLKISHRPQRRKLVLALHNDSLYGPAYNEDGIRQKSHVVKSITIGGLKPSHLRVPDGWNDLIKDIENADTTTEKRKIRRRMLDSPDVKPATSGVVKDRWLREELRDCLRRNGLNPDKFSKTELKRIIEDGNLTLSSGNPIRKVRILWSLTTTPPIKRKKYNYYKNQEGYDENRKSLRYYKPDGNHHIEIREDKKGNWKGDPVTLFDAARRVRPPKDTGLASTTAVDRTDNKDGKFIMSLCIGDTVHMAHPLKEGVVDYFVVFKFSGNRIYFTPHYSTGKAQPKDESKRKRSEIYREEIEVPVSKLKKLMVFNNSIPEKVAISPLGDIRVLVKN